MDIKQDFRGDIREYFMESKVKGELGMIQELSRVVSIEV